MILEGCGIAVVPSANQKRHVINKQLGGISHVLSPCIGIGLVVHGVGGIVV